MPLCIFVLLWIATAGGAQINRWLGAEPDDCTALERRLYGMATGLLTLAYSVLLVGLLGILTIGPILLCCALLALVGWQEHARQARDILTGLKQLRFSPLGIAAALFFIYFAVVSLIGCYTPPTDIEYDSLSYHLADPKIYLAHHKIIYLPWESHSNFAFTMEMLYTIGLALHSVPLSKLFHFTMGVISVAATFLIGRRLHSVWVGLIGSLLLASLPLIFWEAGTAYVDLGAASFGALSLLALIGGLMDGSSDQRWLRVSALMMAAMVSVKATSLISAFLFAAAILVVFLIRKRPLSKAFTSAVSFGLISVIGGSVWYVKSWIVTGNPFFPFAYSLFGGRHWSASNAATYAHSQAQFGAGHRLSDLVMVPWNLIFYLNPAVTGDKFHPFNDFSAYIVSLSPMLLAALFVPAFSNRRASAAVNALALYALISLIIWFALTQQVRYLIPLLPVLCLLAGYVLVMVFQTQLYVRFALAALFAGSVLFSCSIGWLTLAQSELPVATGAVSQESYISEGLPSYPAMEFLNTQTAKTDGVAFYGEPTDYYCDRPYMWAEPGHGIVIPYGKMQVPSDLKNWFLSNGFHYIFIDYSEAPIAPGPGMNGLVYGLTYGSGNAPVFQQGPISIFQLR